MKVQKTGDVYATMALKPSGVAAPAATSASVIVPCRSTAFAGVEPCARQSPSMRSRRKSRPSAQLVRAPVKMAAFMVVSTEMQTISARSTAPLPPAMARITSAATAFESRTPAWPSTAR